MGNLYMLAECLVCVSILAMLIGLTIAVVEVGNG